MMRQTSVAASVKSSAEGFTAGVLKHGHSRDWIIRVGGKLSADHRSGERATISTNRPKMQHAAFKYKTTDLVKIKIISHRESDEKRGCK